MQLRILQSTLFRLALLYAGLFCVSICILLTFVYFSITSEMEDQIKHRITAQINAAAASYRQSGVEEVKKQISEFIEQEDEGLAISMLVDAQGKLVAGNLETWPEIIEYSGKWLLFDIESSRGEDYVHILASDTVLPEGYRLLMGYSLLGPNRTKQTVLDVVSITVALSLLFTALGSITFSRIIKRRLGSVNQICTQVIEGNLDVAVPVTGGADEFDKLADNVNLMLSRIAELVKGLQQTSDNIAHDLRTPLNRHRIRLEGLIAHPPAQGQWQEQLKAGMEEVDSIVETLNSLLRISQAQSGVASGHFVTFDIALAVSDVVDFYAELAEQKNISVQQHIHASLMVTGDKPMLTQAIANLMDNAIKYTPAGGRVAISLTKQDRLMICEVGDNGSGIPADYREKVKERFFRMEASRTSPGTGLGLSLAEAVAKLHRGTLALEDNKPGLKVILSLPIAQ